jgi:hypothetical protein
MRLSCSKKIRQVNFYHPTIQRLDDAASDFHQMGLFSEKNIAHRLAGSFQKTLLSQTPYKRNRRFLHQQWVWATGHIGLTYNLIRWFKRYEPETELVLVSKTAANPHFLKHLLPFLTVIPELQKGLEEEAMFNAVFFGCPDGKTDIVRFNKLIVYDTKEMPYLSLTEEERIEADNLLAELRIKRPYVAFQARNLKDDPKRNVSNTEVNSHLSPFIARGFSVVSTGLDPHPVNETLETVLRLPDPLRASFLLSANCDQFIGSNSGAWTIPWSFNRPVEIMNDLHKAAWIFP